MNGIYTLLLGVGGASGCELEQCSMGNKLGIKEKSRVVVVGEVWHPERTDVFFCFFEFLKATECGPCQLCSFSPHESVCAGPRNSSVGIHNESRGEFCWVTETRKHHKNSQPQVYCGNSTLWPLMFPVSFGENTC